MGWNDYDALRYACPEDIYMSIRRCIYNCTWQLIWAIKVYGMLRVWDHQYIQNLINKTSCGSIGWNQLSTFCRQFWNLQSNSSSHKLKCVIPMKLIAYDNVKDWWQVPLALDEHRRCDWTIMLSQQVWHGREMVLRWDVSIEGEALWGKMQRKHVSK